MLATASLGELNKLGWRVLPFDHLLIDVVAALQPDWVEPWMERVLEQAPHAFTDARLLFEAGLCRKPETEAYILAMMDTFVCI